MTGLNRYHSDVLATFDRLIVVNHECILGDGAMTLADLDDYLDDLEELQQKVGMLVDETVKRIGALLMERARTVTL